MGYDNLDSIRHDSVRLIPHSLLDTKQQVTMFIIFGLILGFNSYKMFYVCPNGIVYHWRAQ